MGSPRVTVLVTGAGGFIGRAVVAALRAREHEVLPWTRADVDLRDAATVREKLRAARPSHAIHLAWDTRPGQYLSAPDNLELLSAGLVLFRELAAIGCRRVVGVGTCFEYDTSFAETDELTTPCRPATLYGAAKLSLGLTGQRFAENAGVSFAWARYNYLYGPHEKPERLVPAAIRAFLADAELPLSSGEQVRDFMHVADCADATAAILESDVVGPINVGGGAPVSIRHLVETIRALVGRGRPLFGARPSNEPARFVPRLDRLFDEVGWRPSIPLEAGLRAVIDAQRTS